MHLFYCMQLVTPHHCQYVAHAGSEVHGVLADECTLQNSPNSDVIPCGAGCPPAMPRRHYVCTTERQDSLEAVQIICQAALATWHEHSGALESSASEHAVLHHSQVDQKYCICFHIRVCTVTLLATYPQLITAEV